MFSDAQRRIMVKRAQLALRHGNLDAACRFLGSANLTALRRGQELRYSLADALLGRAREHAASENLPEALLDVKRALELGGTRPEAVKLRNEILQKLVPPAPRTGPNERPPRRRYLLWIDAVGTYVVLPDPCVTLGGCDTAAEPDIPLSGVRRALAAEIIRTGGRYRISSHGEVAVNGEEVGEALLAPGDRIRIETGPELRFFHPCPANGTAVLKLEQPPVLPGQAREVILLDRLLVLGRAGLVHIPAATGPAGLVVFLRNEEFWVANESPATGRRGAEVRLAPGATAAVGGLSLTITEG